MARVAASVLEVLARSGARRAFGLPGVHNLPLFEPGLAVPVTTVRHEQTAMAAADGWARASGSLGVALVTTGPGAANAVAAFGEARASHSPVVLVASEVATPWLEASPRRGVLHECADQAGIFRPLAKAVLQPRRADDVPAAVAEAAVAALSCPSGPVYLDVPSDLLASTLSTPALGAVDLGSPRRPEVPASLLDQLAELLARSRSPVLLCGGGVVQARAEAHVDRLCRRLGAVVVATFGGRGILPSGHPWMVDAPPHEPEVAALLGEADLVVALGSALDGMTTKNFSLRLGRKLVIVNADPTAMKRGYQPDLGIVGDVGPVLDGLLARLGGLSAAEAERVQDETPARALTAAVRARLAATPAEAPGLAFADAISAGLVSDSVVVCDMAVAGYWVGGYATLPGTRMLQYPVGWGTLGLGLPAGVGAASTGRPTLVVAGDGGLAMALGELATLVEQRLPLVLLVVDDGGYGMLRFDQRRSGRPASGTDLLAPDWGQLASAFGLPFARVPASGDGLSDAINSALAPRAPAMLLAEASLVPPRTTSPRWGE